MNFKPAILLFTVIAIAANLSAQVTTNEKLLQQASREMKTAEDLSYKNALALAKQKNWDLILTGKNGDKAYLVGILPDGTPKYYTTYSNAIAAATTRANQLWNGGATGLNLSGSSANMKNKLAVWDGGKVLATHVELTGRITQKDNPSTTSDHATHVTGTLMATGINPIAKGMSFGLQGILAYDFTNDVSEILGESAGLLLSNHSYGIVSGWYYNTSPTDGGGPRWEFRGRHNENEDYKFGYYNNDAQALDSIAYNAPNYLIVKAAGNSRNDTGAAVGQPYYRYNSGGTMASAGNRPAGIYSNNAYDIIPMDANAKNILTVGAVQPLTTPYTKKEDVIMTSFSCWGPTDDGRIKPDIVGNGANVTSSVASGTSAYGTLSGSSMATPNVAGSLFLLQEYYSQLKSGAFMRSATLKGLAIHTAEEAGDAPGPDYKFGWGLLNVEKASKVIKAAVTSSNASTSEHLLFENTLNNGSTFTTTVIASGKGQLSATLCWTDVKGNVTPIANALNDRTIKLVNDLDLRISKAATVYRPWILDPLVPSANATTGDNIRDNVEKINIDDVVPGQAYTVTISHKGTLNKGFQAYSLLVSGVGGSAICTSSATATIGTRIDSVGITTIKNKTAAGCTNYRDYTSLTADIEANQTTPITIRLSSCDATTNNKIVKVFIDFNCNGVFTDAGELVATSGLISGGGTFTTNINTPAGLTIGNYAIMRIVAQETNVSTDINPCGTYISGETQDYRVRFVQPGNDIAISEIVSPVSGDCSNASQLVAVRIQNNGSANRSNIPLTLTVLNGTTTVASVNVVCPLIIPASSSAVYTFQKTFNSLPSTTYAITVNATATGDQDATNNTLTGNFSIAAIPAAPVAMGVKCSASSSLFKITNPVNGANYFWYDSPTSTTPIGTGSELSLSTVPSGNTLYVSSGIRANAGLASKNIYPNGGYQTNGGNYLKYNATAPLVLESVRMFTRFPGRLNVEVINLVSENATTGHSFNPLESKPVNVFSSHPTPVSGTINNNNDAADTGAIYYVGMNLPYSGATISHALRVTTADTLVNIFRNNNITNNPYPFSVPNVFTITGNSAFTPTSNFQSFYYYLYDMKLKTADCISARGAVTISATSSGIKILLAGTNKDSLETNVITDIQWYLNGNAINGSTAPTIKPKASGNYTVSGTDANGCSFTSAPFAFTIDGNNVNPDEVNLLSYPNPSRGSFTANFEVNNLSTVQVQITDMWGKVLYYNNYGSYIGSFTDQYNLGNVANGVYILKVLIGDKKYNKKIVVAR